MLGGEALGDGHDGSVLVAVDLHVVHERAHDLEPPAAALWASRAPSADIANGDCRLSAGAFAAHGEGGFAGAVGVLVAWGGLGGGEGDVEQLVLAGAES